MNVPVYIHVYKYIHIYIHEYAYIQPIGAARPKT